MDTVHPLTLRDRFISVLRGCVKIPSGYETRSDKLLGDIADMLLAQITVDALAAEEEREAQKRRERRSR